VAWTTTVSTAFAGTGIIIFVTAEGDHGSCKQKQQRDIDFPFHKWSSKLKLFYKQNSMPARQKRKK
jgi:hypothetical protein